MPNRCQDKMPNKQRNIAFNFMDFSAKIYLFKINKKNTKRRCELDSELTMKTPEQRLSFLFRKYF